MTETAAEQADPEAIKDTKVAPLEVQENDLDNKRKSICQKIDDWLWCNNHKKFADLVSEKQDKMCKINAYRITAFIILLLPILPIFAYAFSPQYEGNGFLLILWMMLALTTWGMALSCFFFGIGMRLSFKKEEEINDANKYNFFAAWKWYIVVFELTMCMNIVITIVFWAVIAASKDVFSRTGFFLAYTTYIHSVPLVTFIGEYCIHPIPVIKRHIAIVLPIGIFYSLMNLTHAKITGKPIYPPMSWDSVASVSFGLGVVVFAVASYFFVYWINQKKLKRSAQHQEIIELCELQIMANRTIEQQK